LLCCGSCILVGFVFLVVLVCCVVNNEEHEPHQNTRTTTQQTKTTRNTNPIKIQEPQHSKLKRRGTRTPSKYKNHNTAN
jgi:hypothetical protein